MFDMALSQGRSLLADVKYYFTMESKQPPSHFYYLLIVFGYKNVAT